MKRNSPRKAKAPTVETPEAESTNGEKIRVGDFVNDDEGKTSGIVAGVFDDVVMLLTNDDGRYTPANAKACEIQFRGVGLSKLAEMHGKPGDTFTVGQVVVVDGPIVAQIVHRDGDAVILQPLADSNGNPTPNAPRIGWELSDNVDALSAPLPWLPRRSSAA